jgi:hypothetical protein
MRTELSAVQMTTSPEERRATAPRNGAGAPHAMSPLARRVHAEYREMPGLRLTVRQAARLFSVAPDLADVRLIRFGGHLPKGGYDVHTDGRDLHEPASTPAVR